jgi:hypothetical protein
MALIMIGEWIMFWKEALMSYLKILPQYSPGDIDGNLKMS